VFAYLITKLADERVAFVVVFTGPPGVYSPDVAGLYMSEQHMMRPPGKTTYFHVEWSTVLAILMSHSCLSVSSRLHWYILYAVTMCCKFSHGSRFFFLFSITVLRVWLINLMPKLPFCGVENANLLFTVSAKLVWNILCLATGIQNRCYLY